MYKIERNGVVIQKESGTGKYPFLTMLIGDRFRVPIQGDIMTPQRVSKNASHYGRQYARKFITWTSECRKYVYCKRVK